MKNFKNAFFVTFLSLIPFSLQSQGTRSLIRLVVGDLSSSEHRGNQTTVTLIQEGNHFYCQSATIPEHEVKVSWLKSLSPPDFLKVKSNKQHCPKELKWGQKRLCFDESSKDLLLELLRACVQI